jgi:peptide methionine sulfoxide reductase msrA/msrB
MAGAARMSIGLKRLMLLLALGLPGCGRAADVSELAAGPGHAAATFAGGCFWCTESDFEKLPGVIEAQSGYSGGRVANPSYEQVSSGGTGHAEAVRVIYDPKQISYARLLEHFWRSIDPTDAGGQFCDRGAQYRSAIFVHDEGQRRVAEESRQRLRASGVLGKPVVTEIGQLGAFYPAEDYHQDYYKKNPLRYKWYRSGCGRDKRLSEVWGKSASK